MIIKRDGSLGVGFASIGAWGLAFASAPAARADVPPTAQIEEVVVTAQRREERLQDVPIAVSSFSGATLEKLHIETVEDVALHTPNLTLVPQASGNTTYAVNMRGVGLSDSVISADSPVGMYVDGVVVSKMAGGVFDLTDLERVEVLRGPQGTLYGRNAPAGAINIITRKPGDAFDAEVTVGGGNYAEREVRASVDTGSFGLGGAGTLAVRLSGHFLQRDGWARDTVSGWLDSRHRWEGRLSLRWKPADGWLIDYAFDKSTINEKPPAAQLTKDFTGFLGAFVKPTRQDVFTLSYSLANPGPGPFGIGASNTKLQIDSHALTAQWDVAPNTVLKSITGYRTLSDQEPTDFDGTPVAWADFNVLQSLKTFSEELQVLGHTPDENLSYVAGLFAYNEKANTAAPGVFGFATVNQTSVFRTNNSSYAIYGQLDWKPPVLDRKLTLTLGVRETEDERQQLDDQVFVNGASVLNIPKLSKTFNKFTPAFTASYAFTRDLSTYARFAEGYRSGGFNARATTPVQAQVPFEPESLNSYEVGLKGLFFDRRLRVDLAGFVSDYKNLQVALTEPGANGIGFATVNENIGKIRISGLELESELAVTPNLSFNLTYAYLDTDVIDYTVCLPQGSPACQFQNVGNSLLIPLISRNSFDAGFDWKALRTASGTLRISADAQYKSASLGGGPLLKEYLPISTDPSYIPSYCLIDGKLTWEGVKVGDGTLSVSAWGKNLTNRATAQFSVNLATSLGTDTTRFLTPRTYGVDVNYKFR